MKIWFSRLMALLSRLTSRRSQCTDRHGRALDDGAVNAIAWVERAEDGPFATFYPRQRRGNRDAEEE